MQSAQRPVRSVGFRYGPEGAPRAAMLFAAGALALSGLYWALFAAQERGWWTLGRSEALLGALRGYGPALSALVVACVLMRRRGWREIVDRLLHWRFSPALWCGALAVPLVAVVLAVLIATRGDLSVLQPGVRPVEVATARLVLLFFVFALVDGPLGEELGWRGFLLPRLLERLRPIGASLLIGVLWFLWHLPLYLADGDAFSAVFSVRYLLLNVGYALLHTWFFLRTGGSALVAVVLHTAGNYSIFLALTLLPALAQVPQLRAWHTAVILFFGLIAAADLQRRRDRSS